MIRLIQLPPAFGLPNASPFCLKLETWLRMAGLPYENVYTANPRSTPKGKLPAIEDGKTRMGDSGLIVAYLQKTYGVDPDADLTKAEKAVSLAWQRLMEEHLYWAMIHTRWGDEAGWQRTRQEFFGRMPWPVGVLVPPLIRRSILGQLRGQGMGRHQPEEIYQLAMDDLDAMAAFLGEKPFFMGKQPTSIDAVAYGFLANILRVAMDTPLRRRALACPAFSDYCARMENRYWPQR